MTPTYPETIVLHAGWRHDAAANAVAVPICRIGFRCGGPVGAERAAGVTP